MIETRSKDCQLLQRGTGSTSLRVQPSDYPCVQGRTYVSARGAHFGAPLHCRGRLKLEP